MKRKNNEFKVQIENIDVYIFKTKLTLNIKQKLTNL